MSKTAQVENTLDTVPSGHNVKKVSSLIDSKTGEVKLQWIQAAANQEEIDKATLEMFAAMADKLPRVKPLLKPKKTQDRLLTNYIIGDAHLGMYAWGEEAGEDFDLEIAERDLCSAMKIMVADAPPSEECLIVQLGDFLHIDDRTGETPGNKNKQDFDSRYLKIVRVAIRTMRFLINEALKKHAHVRVRNVLGNHDPHSSIAVTLALIGHYSKEFRVTIEDSPKEFWYTYFGENLIGITHGDKVKHAKMADVLSVNAKSLWCKEFKYCWHGHIHHKKVTENNGVITESFRTLAAKDAWHAGQGYDAGREMTCIVLDKEYGEVERYTCGIRRARYG